VRLASHSVVYRFDVSRQLAKVAHTVASIRLSSQRTPAQANAVQPHSVAERASFVSWARTLSTPHKRHNAQALLALAAGAGLTAQQIMNAQVGDVEFDEGRAFVTVREHQVRRIPVRRAWVSTLTQAIGTRTSGDAFRGFRSDEYPPYKLQQFLTRNRGEFRPSVARLRSGWLVELIDANLPMDVLLAVTGFTTPSSLRPYLRYTQSHNHADWLTTITGEASA
jgi:integrase